MRTIRDKDKRYVTPTPPDYKIVLSGRRLTMAEIMAESQQSKPKKKPGKAA
jgi:hypothetical protein